MLLTRLILKRYIFYLSLIGTLIFSNGKVGYTMPNNNYKYKAELDRSFELLEKAFRYDNIDLICEESKNSIKTIKKGGRFLRNIEPFYDWEEIEKVIQKNLEEYC
tara:strand:+ start:51 stop:365 length:315 start_codon:yes stop_codon:yes gene_type:complete